MPPRLTLDILKFEVLAFLPLQDSSRLMRVCKEWFFFLCSQNDGFFKTIIFTCPPLFSFVSQVQFLNLETFSRVPSLLQVSRFRQLFTKLNPNNLISISIGDEFMNPRYVGIGLDHLLSFTRLEKLDIPNIHSMQETFAFKQGRSFSNNSITSLQSLSPLSSLRSISLFQNESISSLEDICLFRHLKSLKLNSLARVPSLTPLTFCNSIEELDIWNCNINSVQQFFILSALSSLTLLKIPFDPNHSLDVVEKLSNLTHLALQFKTHSHMKQPEGLFHLTQLKELIFKNEWIDSLASLIYFHHLVHLELDGKELKSLDGIGNCPELAVLKLNTNKQVSSLEPLANCVKLKILHLPVNKDIQSLGGLENCMNLRELNLEANRLILSLDPLEYCAELEKMDISSCENIESLLPLTRMEKLKLHGKAGLFVHKEVKKRLIKEILRVRWNIKDLVLYDFTL